MQLSKPKIELLYGSIFGLIGGIVVIWMIGTIPTTSKSFWVSFVIIAIAVLIWSFKGGKNWWMAFVVFVTFGGVFWVGFKIYPAEIGLLFAIMALVFATVIKGKNLRQDRSKISWAFSLLILYFILHMLASLYKANVGLMNGGGSIIRSYSTGMTFLVFGWLYYRFGSTKNITNVFIIILIINSIRIGFGLYAYFFSYTSSLSEPGWTFLGLSTDLRSSVLYQIYAAIIIFYLIKNRNLKVGVLLLIVLSFIIVFLGQGRVAVLEAMLAISLWVIIEKRYGLLIFILSIFIFLFILVNTKVYEDLPFEIQRSVSFMVLNKNKIYSYYPFASDQWHFDLFKTGFDNWSDSAYSLFFGNCIDPSDVWRFGSFDFFNQVKIASAMARYESSLWTVLATLGIIGISLYTWVLTFLFRNIIPIVKRDGIKSFNHAVYAIAIISFVLMILLGWIRGGFPDYEIMLGVMGKSLYEDRKKVISNTS